MDTMNLFVQKHEDRFPENPVIFCSINFSADFRSVLFNNWLFPITFTLAVIIESAPLQEHLVLLEMPPHRHTDQITSGIGSRRKHSAPVHDGKI